MGIHLIYKPIGKTPLDMLGDIKEKKKSYAGRLDPMAHGLMLILTNEHCLMQNEFHNFDKQYKFDILIGFSTDTSDILGFLKNKTTRFFDKNTSPKKNTICKIIKEIIGQQYQYYPPYSSVRINKKPLWFWAKNNMLDNITIPGKFITIYSLDLIFINKISGVDLKKQILKKLAMLGDRQNCFREREIIEQWENVDFNDYYTTITLDTYVSCGTYIRELSNLICSKLMTNGLCLDIYRDMVGEYVL